MSDPTTNPTTDPTTEPAADPHDGTSASSRAPRRTTYGGLGEQRIDGLAAAGAVDDQPGVSLIRSAWQRLRRNPVFLLGLAITVAFVVLAVVAPWIAPWDVTDRPLL